jgi:ATP-dependent RNA helicase DHX37/DHR1
MKSMHIDVVVNFPFPTPPDFKTLVKAEELLTNLGALAMSPNRVHRQITELGKAMSLFPLSPRFSRMLVMGRQQGCLPYIISIVSALSVGDPFLHEEGLEVEDKPDEDSDVELSHITSEEVKAKLAQRLRRRAFFQSQHVSLSLPHGFRVIIYDDGPFRLMLN